MTTELTASHDGRLERVSRVITRCIAIVTAIVAAAVPITEWVRGISEQRLKEIQERSEMAVTYLGRLTTPDLKIGDRIMLLSALSQLEGHPLQKWAQAERDSEAQYLSKLKQLGETIQKSVDSDLTAQTKYDQLQSEIDIAKMKLSLASNPAELEEQRQLLFQLNIKRNEVRATVDLNRVIQKYKERHRDGQLLPMADLASVAATIASYASDSETKIAALRWAATLYWQAGNRPAAQQSEADGREVCRGARERTFRIDRECIFLEATELMAAYVALGDNLRHLPDSEIRTLLGHAKLKVHFAFLVREFDRSSELSDKITFQAADSAGVKSGKEFLRMIFNTNACNLKRIMDREFWNASNVNLDSESKSDEDNVSFEMDRAERLLVRSRWFDLDGGLTEHQFVLDCRSSKFEPLP